MDYHDEVMVDWRDSVLGQAELFCHSNKLDYAPLHCDSILLDEHERKVEEFEKMIALDYSKGTVGKFDDYDRAYLPLWEKEMELMRHLSSYIAEMQKNIYFVRFGQKR